MDITYYIGDSGLYTGDMRTGDRPATEEELRAYFGDPLESARAAKIEEINAGYDTVMEYIQAGYPLKEVLSWETQASQAQALADNPEAQALFVRALAATKGVTVEEMAGRILDNARNWEPVTGMLTAQRQIMEEAAWAAQSVEEVEAIKVGYKV